MPGAGAPAGPAPVGTQTKTLQKRGLDLQEDIAARRVKRQVVVAADGSGLARRSVHTGAVVAISQGGPLGALATLVREAVSGNVVHVFQLPEDASAARSPASAACRGRRLITTDGK